MVYSLVNFAHSEEQCNERDEQQHDWYHAALCSWLQEEIDRDPGAVRFGRASQRLAHQAILKIAAPALVTQRDLRAEKKYG